MIKQISLRFFRKHEDLVINLAEGLQTFRGSNEAGKTTILEGMAYALFGSKALRNTLSEVVTWGHKDNELRAEVVYQVDADTTYIFQRSKGGAEVYLNQNKNPFVTGQNEVSSFAASLLGADVNTAHHLMLSGQGGLRGVLEQGPKATASLIETLSDLDLIDRLVEAAQEKLQLGSTAVLEDRLKGAETILREMAPVEEPKQPDTAATKSATDLLKVEEKAATEALKKAEDALQSAKVEVARSEQMVKAVDDLRKQIEETEANIAEERQVASSPVPSIKGIEDAITRAQDWHDECKAWTAFHTVPVVAETVPREEAEAQRVKITKRLKELQGEITGLTIRAGTLRVDAKGGDTCQSCGQPVDHLPGRKEKIEAARKEFAEVEAKIKAATDEQTSLTDEQVKLAAVFEQDMLIMSKVSKLSKFVDIDTSMVPAIVKWSGGVVDCEEGPDLVALNMELDKARSIQASVMKAQAKVEALTEVLEKSKARKAALKEQLEAMNLPTPAQIADLTLQVVEATDNLSAITGQISINQIMIENAESEYQRQLQAYQSYVQRKKDAEEAVTRLVTDIEVTGFNNGLIKKLRGARPIIANKLWNLVLATVSTLFSQMRGEQSVVTKVKEGFLVNGRPVESMSGSTQDILGLAIRCALIKTFVPNCPLLILDEPSAACDMDRSAALVGFVAAAGFKQVIMVTHEDVSESLSSNLVQL